MSVREAEMYGDYGLSIQASKHHYCEPRTGDGTEPLDQYKSVEVAILPGLKKPSDIGLDASLDELFEGDDVAGWVKWDDIDRLRTAMRERGEAKDAGQ